MGSNMKKILLLLMLIAYLAISPPNVSAAPYKIGAYYFGYFSNEMFTTKEISDSYSWNYGSHNPSNFGSQAMYNRINDAWAGVRDLYESNRPFLNIPGISWWDEDWQTYRAHFKPVIGYYDSGDPLVLEKQITQATQNGLSFFNFYWYWDSQTQEELYASGLHSFLKARNKSDMQFMLSIFEHGWASTISRDDIPKVTTILANYTKEPNYLKTSDGRPIIQLGDASGIKAIDPINPDWSPAEDLSTVNYFVATLKQKTKEVTGKEAYITYRFARGSQSWDDGSFRIDGINAFSCIAPSIEPYTNYSLLDSYGKTYNKAFMPCMFSWYDERPRLGLLKGKAQMSFVDEYRITLPNPQASLVTNMTAAKSWMDTKQDEISHILTIYAWNEWHEGGIIEPNVKNKSMLLNAIANVFGLIKGSDPCRITGQCSYLPNSNLFVPIGNIENISANGLVAGWAADQDAGNGSVAVHFYLDGPVAPPYANNIGSIKANLPRLDVLAIKGFGKNSGFTFQIPVNKINDGKSHTLYVYGINVGRDLVAGGDNPLINTNGTAVPIYIPPIIVPGDYTNDGHVDIFDYNKVVSEFGTTYTIFDFNKVIENFGT